MKTLKFVSKDRAQFTATLRKNVNEYFITQGISTKGNLNMGLKSLTMLGLYLAPFILMLTLPLGDWSIFPFSVLMGLGMAGIGMGVMHDAAHGSFSKKTRLNKLLGTTMYLIGGNTFAWKVQHNILHHTYTNIQGYDEDIEPKGSLRLSRQTPLKKIHRFQHFYAFFLYCFMTLLRVFNEFFRIVKYNREGITRQQGSTPRKEMARLILTKLAYFTVIIGLPLILTPFSFWMILLGFLIMHAVASLYMTVVFQLAHIVEITAQPKPDAHDMIHNEWMIHELETTANFARRSRFFTWMIGGLNYQIEHHLFPHICHIHYKNIAPIVERTANEFGLRYNENTTFLTALGSHFKTLKALGR